MALLKSLVKTCTTAATTLGSVVVPVGSIISVDGSGVVYIGDSTLNAGTTGFKLPNAPLTLGNYENTGEAEYIDLSKVYVQGGSGSEVVRVLYFHEDRLT